MGYNPKKEYAALKWRADKYATDISKIYSNAVNELLKLIPSDADADFSFEANPALKKKAQDILRRMQATTAAAITKDVKLEWAKGNEAADQFLETKFGKSVLNDPMFAGWTQRNGEALDAFIKMHLGGMKLSDRIWQTAEQLRDEMQLAVSVSIGSGTSASQISREVRKYLKEPDRLFRKVKVGTNADGTPKYDLSKAAKAFHSGQGVYRSSYKNAMRLARTETNAAYRTADAERWKQMDFVKGIRIQTSHNHPDMDICDQLAGDYPKDFKFTGWHPQCFCFATPITVDNDTFVEMQKALLAGEEIPAPADAITDMPQNFIDWCEDNKGRIALAKDKGTLPYFLSDNPEKLSEALSFGQLKEALKTEEYQLGKAALGEMKEFPDMDTSAMAEALKKGNIEAIKTELGKFQQIKTDLGGLTYIDDALVEAKKWGYKNIFASEKNVAEHLAKWKDAGGWQMVEKSSEWYANKYLGGNMLDKASGLYTHQKFPHWEVMQKAYVKQAAVAKEEFEWQGMKEALKQGKINKGSYVAGYDKAVSKLESAILQKDMSLATSIQDEMNWWISTDESISIAGAKVATSPNGKGVMSKLLAEVKTAAAEGKMGTTQTKLSELQAWFDVEAEWKAKSAVFEGVSSKPTNMLKAAYRDALESGNMVQAKAALQEAEKWHQIIPAYKEAAAFKSKSAQYNQLVSELENAIDEGDIVLAQKKQAEIAEKRALLDKKYGKGKDTGKGVFSDSYSQARKDAAVWDKGNGDIADDALFDSTSKSWKEAIKRETETKALISKYESGMLNKTEFEAALKAKGLKVYPYERYGTTYYLTEREAVYGYTSSYCPINEPLENRRYFGGQHQDHFYAKVNAMTDFIDTCQVDTDMWFQRGDNDLSAIFGRLEFAGTKIPNMPSVSRDYLGSSISDGVIDELQQLVGLKMQEGGFMSMGSAKRHGFTESEGKRVIINIFAPKGTKAVYAENFSAFGCGASSSGWDGVSRTRYYSHEFETIAQRGTQMKITRIYKGKYNSRDIIYMDVEIVGQDVKDISYVKKSNIGD